MRKIKKTQNNTSTHT